MLPYGKRAQAADKREINVNNKTNSAEKGKNYIGIDIGGTSIKGIIIKRDGTVLGRHTVTTGTDDGDVLCGNIAEITENLLTSVGGSAADVEGVGIGCPGLIDSKNGRVVFAGNLNLKNYPLAKSVSDRVGLPVKITNDANAAALGEAVFGAGSAYKDSILVTLGTGVGGGIVIDGKLFEGGNSAGTEIGHTVIVKDGLQCTCGRRGCLERYASARALTEQTKAAMQADKNSKMWKGYDLNTACGKTPFDYMDSDPAAKAVVDSYLGYLSCGITNLVNVFRPQAVMLGGGVSEQGERLTLPLQKLVDGEIFAGVDYAPVKIVKAALGNDAGAFGAAALMFD